MFNTTMDILAAFKYAFHVAAGEFLLGKAVAKGWTQLVSTDCTAWAASSINTLAVTCKLNHAHNTKIDTKFKYNYFMKTQQNENKNAPA